MKDRKAYMADYYIKNKPSPEVRRALALSVVDKRRKQQQEYRDRLNPPSAKTLQRRAEREAYRAKRAAELLGGK